ncbi:MAG TPA: hypothetical protein VGG34_01490 [Opitutaceae bacterium]|jgi:hypothetical protein
MKAKITILAIALAAVAFAQTLTPTPTPTATPTPVIVQSPEYPWRLQVDFTYVDGALTAAPITQFYQSDITQGSDVIAQPPSVPPSLTVDLVANGSKTVTIGGTTYTYAQVIAMMTAIFAQERAAQLAPTPTPTPTP